MTEVSKGRTGHKRSVGQGVPVSRMPRTDNRNEVLFSFVGQRSPGRPVGLFNVTVCRCTAVKNDSLLTIDLSLLDCPLDVVHGPRLAIRNRQPIASFLIYQRCMRKQGPEHLLNGNSLCLEFISWKTTHSRRFKVSIII